MFYPLIQVTTTSRLLTNAGKDDVMREVGLNPKLSTILSLQQFDTEEQFGKTVQKFLDECRDNDKHILFIQSEVSNHGETLNLVECARYVVQDLVRKYSNKTFLIVFLLHIPRVAGGCFTGLSVNPWISYHIDELRKKTSTQHGYDIAKLKNKSVADVFENEYVKLDDLIKECLPKAASQVIGNVDSQRMHKRIDILMELFDTDFTERVKQKILAVVKTESANKVNQEKWLVSMAIKSNFLKEGFTFQKSIFLHLSDIVTPVLTNIISFCDADFGLDLLEKGQEWMKDVFIFMFQTASTEDMKAMDYGQHSFASKFPMSRYLVNLLEAYHAQSRNAEISCSQLLSLFTTSPFRPLLTECFENRRFRAIDVFMPDFVNIKYPNLNKEVLDVICQEIFIAAEKEMKNRIQEQREQRVQADDEDAELDETGDTTMSEEENIYAFVTPVDVYIAHQKLKNRLHFLSILCTFMPSIANVETLRQFMTQEDKDFYADIKAFAEIVKRCEPKPELLVDEEHRREWCAKIDKLSALNHQLTTLKLPKDQIIEDFKEQIAIDLRRMIIVKLYVSHVLKDVSDRELVGILTAKIKMLNLKLKKNTLKSGKEFKKLLDVFQKLNEDVSKHHFHHGEDSCIICQEDINEPVELDCKHVGCKECIEDYIKDKPDDQPIYCPVEKCKKEFPSTFTSTATKVTEDLVKRHKNFKQNVNMFFLDVLQRFVFDEKTGEPEEDVVKTLMTFIVTKELPKDKSAVGQRTKQISPFAGHCIDSTPVIRSFLLQLILHGAGHEVK